MAKNFLGLEEGEMPKLDPKVEYWRGEIAQAEKRESEFRKQARRVTAIYEGKTREDNSFNIVYSNTETIAPALYNSVPRPVVQRRFKDEDPLGKNASLATQRVLEYLVDDGMGCEASFDDLMKSAVLEAAVPGRGVTRFSYDATFKRVESPDQAGEGQEASGEEGEGTSAESEGDSPAGEEIDKEMIYGEEVPWDRFRHGYAKKWAKMPWVAFEHVMDREEVTESFGEAIAAICRFENLKRVGENADGSGEEDTRGTENIKVIHVHEIWDKTSKTVKFVSDNCDVFLKEVPDPCKLSGFFPCPQPLSFVSRISSLTPAPLYTFYEEQAKELNRITIRINKLVVALKVRGFYDNSIEGLHKVLEADDNQMLPANNVASVQQNNALASALWFVPLEPIVKTLLQLYQQREQVKSVIYEITGIADIMRGSTQASETLGAQELKNQWGTLRLKRLQKEVMRYSRDCLRIMAELATTKLQPETLSKMTGLPYPTGVQKQQAQVLLQQWQQQAMLQPPQPGPDGQPPAPPQPPQQLTAILQQPSWDDILGVLRDDLERSFRIDIETNSTVDAEATEDKQNIGELLNAISQFLNGVAPLIENGSMPFEVAQGMLLAIVRRFRFGPELEDELKKMKAPQPPADPKVEAAKMQAQHDQQMFQMEQQSKQQDFALKQQEMQMELKKMAMEMQALQQEHALKAQEMMLNQQLMQQKHQTDLQALHAKVAAAHAMPKKQPAAKTGGNTR